MNAWLTTMGITVGGKTYQIVYRTRFSGHKIAIKRRPS